MRSTDPQVPDERDNPRQWSDHVIPLSDRGDGQRPWLTSWPAAGAVLHERVREMAFDRLTARLVELHAPVDQGGELPVCCGCDQASRRDPPAMWPCRTYTLLAARLCGLASGGVEAELMRLRTTPRPSLGQPAGGDVPGGGGE
ncbi:MAG: hypothetical protein HYR62_06730 [Actinobacteria bacterium]|nr:hypothetical protein [Actinomycetota bacterium]